jgi:anti-sigma factor RsiW
MKPAEDNPQRTDRHVEANYQKIIEYSQGGLSTADRGKLEVHLQICPQCQRALAEAQRVEAVLQNRFSGVKLSASFEQRVYARLESEPIRQDATQQRERALAEFNEYTARLRRQLFRPGRLLDVASYAIGAGLLAWLVIQLSPAMENHIEASWSNASNFRGLLVPSLAAALIAVCLFLFAFKGSIKALLEES